MSITIYMFAAIDNELRVEKYVEVLDNHTAGCVYDMALYALWI